MAKVVAGMGVARRALPVTLAAASASGRSEPSIHEQKALPSLHFKRARFKSYEMMRVRPAR